MQTSPPHPPQVSSAEVLLERWKQQFPYEDAGSDSSAFFWIPSVAEVPSALWPASSQVIHSKAWHALVEQHLPESVEVGYLVVAQEQRLTMIVAVHFVDLPFARIQHRLSRFATWMLKCSTVLSRSVEGQQVIKALVVGDLNLTASRPANWEMSVLDSGVLWLQRWHQKCRENRLQVIKDLSPLRDSTGASKTFGFEDCVSEPEMIVQIDSSWATLDDYVATLTKKYRHRYKNARKKLAPLTSRVLQNDEVNHHKRTLEELFQEVLAHQQFVLFNEEFAFHAKCLEQLGDNFTLRVYETEERIVGFATAIHNDQTLIAHRVGLTYEYNQTHKLYQNILYDHIEHAIALGCRNVSFGRTALEIKSAVGATAVPLQVLMRHSDWFTHRVLRLVLRNIPEIEWVERNPFRESVAHSTQAADTKSEPL